MLNVFEGLSIYVWDKHTAVIRATWEIALGSMGTDKLEAYPTVKPDGL